jgi:hypothetical protein
VRPDSIRTIRGALAGAAAAAVWAAQQPLDKRLFGVDHDDAQALGRLVVRDHGHAATAPVGLAIHLANGALFGALYAKAAPSLPGPRIGRGVAVAIGEGFATWPLMALVDPQLLRSPRALGQAVWRHALFGAVLGELERRLNPSAPSAPAEDEHGASNGHGDVSRLVVVQPA